MRGTPNSSVRSRRVSSELRRLREDAGLTGAQVAETLGMSASKISRIETGHRGLYLDDVAALLGLYRVTDRRRDEILDLVKQANERGGWHGPTANLPEQWQKLIDFERRATEIQNFETLVVPGLLQTADYAGAIIQGINKTIPEADLDTLVGARMVRQTVLRRRDLRYLAVIDEVALHRIVGDPGVMRRQLRHLVGEAERPNITLRVIPMAGDAYAGLRGPFAILHFADEPSVVYMENQQTCLFMEDRQDLAGYQQALTDILAETLTPEESVELVARLAEQG